MKEKSSKWDTVGSINPRSIEMVFALLEKMVIV